MRYKMTMNILVDIYKGKPREDEVTLFSFFTLFILHQKDYDI
jgi:hypothetical protein